MISLHNLGFVVPLNVVNESITTVDNYKGHKNDIYADNNLKLLQLNVRSLLNMNKFDLFLDFLDSFPNCFDILILSETWLNDNCFKLYSIPGFNAVHACRDRIGGGLAVYVSVRLKFKVYEVLSSDFFSISISVEVDKPKRDVNITAYYRPPVNNNIDRFLTHFEGILNSQRTNFHVCVGDFNINVMSINSMKPNSLSLKFINLLQSYDFYILNSCVTRPMSNSILDLVIARFPSDIFTYNCTIENTLSDHNAICTLFGIKKYIPDERMTKKTINYTDLCEKLTTVFSNKPQFSDANEYFSFFLKSIQNTTNEVTTEYAAKNKTSKKYCPWMNSTLKAAIATKNNLYRKFKCHRHNSYLKQKLKSATLHVTKLQTHYKTEHYKLLFNSSNNPRDTWRNIDNVLGRSCKPVDIQLMDAHGEPVAKDMVSSQLNKFFVNVANSLCEELVLCDDDNINYFDTLPSSRCSLFLRPTDNLEVFNLINAINVNKSTGADKISGMVLKRCIEPITPVLSDIINLMLSTGIYPDHLKIAKVSPVYKSGSKTCSNNYRPISVLPIINNIIEKIVYCRIKDFLTKNNFFYKYQYGFREKCGTHIATIELLDNILINIDKKNIVSGLFLDLSKAFDCVNHSILLYKLQNAGVRGIALSLVQSYLSNRKQFVCANGIESDLLNICIGVPQGSVLGPLLFLIYINDIYKLPLVGELFLFADDSAIFYSDASVSQNLDNMSSDYLILSKYFRLNRLTLNDSKCNLVHFRSRCSTKVNKENGVLKFGNVIIKPVSHVKYLGLYMDEFLKWNVHTARLASKVSCRVGILRRIKSFLPSCVLKTIYFAFIHSQLSYLTCIWGNSCLEYKKPIELLQRRALKYVFKLPMRFSSDLLFKEYASNVLNVQSLFISGICKYMFESIHAISYSTVVFKRSSHNYSTRNRDQLKRPLVSSLYGSKSISFIGPTLFNKLPNDIRLSFSLTSFKFRLKKWLLQVQ